MPLVHHEFDEPPNGFATVVDGTGLMIYFWIAHLTLSQLNGL